MRPFSRREKNTATVIASLLGIALLAPERLEIPLPGQTVGGYNGYMDENNISITVWAGDEENPLHVTTHYHHGEEKTSLSVSTHTPDFDHANARGFEIDNGNGQLGFDVHYPDEFGKLSVNKHTWQYWPRGKER